MVFSKALLRTDSGKSAVKEISLSMHPRLLVNTVNVKLVFVQM